MLTYYVGAQAGLLRPNAAAKLVGAIRAEFPDLPIHVHTHDTAGTGAASMLAAAEAGADAVDVALDAMSGLTSQPSMGAVVAALRGTPLDTGVDLERIAPLNDYWEECRGLCAWGARTPSGPSPHRPHPLHAKHTLSRQTRRSRVDKSQGPPTCTCTRCPAASTPTSCSNRSSSASPAGGPPSSAPTPPPTAFSATLSRCAVSGRSRAPRTLTEPRNPLPMQVTPSSKVVGDLAQFMVQNDLSEEEVMERAEELSFPQSVVEYLQGYLGVPHGGFPEPFRSRVLKVGLSGRTPTCPAA